jgi:menaquinone-9 beta-reductase
MTAQYDVIVIGAGPGGSTTAHYLARDGARVLLLDKASFPRDKTCGDGLTPRAVGMLQDMGLLEQVASVGQRISRFEVVAPNQAVTQSPIPTSGALPNHSLVVPRFLLDEKLLQRAIDSGAQFEAGMHVTRVSHDTLATVHAGHDGQQVTYRAPMVVIATGANTRLLMTCGILQHPPETMVAARAYFAGLRGLSDVWQLRFDGVPLPGYGWIFPTGDGTANIGAGYFARARTSSAARAFEQFMANSALRPMLSEARQLGPMKSYPLRADFTTAPTHAERILLVGEAAGLVNPLTGEGIDYAMESGRVAAAHLHGMLARNDFSAAARQAYDAELREHYQSLFEFCIFVRDRLCDKAWLLNTLVHVSKRRADLRTKLATVVLGGRAVRGKLTVGRVLRAALTTRQA